MVPKAHRNELEIKIIVKREQQAWGKSTPAVVCVSESLVENLFWILINFSMNPQYLFIVGATITTHHLDILAFVWYNICEVREMLIESVIQNEATRNEQMISEYEALLAELPKGSLICRKNEYYYLKYRENGKVCEKYIGKEGSTTTEIREKIELRRHYTKMLSKLKREQKTIHTILEGIT